ncbi:MAG: hypothetical protein JST54_27845 [Deltaproteobacteria bacterium]|nr:hypothetical protein [Deltaproteobacteria bacterium]
MAKKVDGWRLISVLFSNRPLSPALAMTLYQAAADLHRRDGKSQQIAGDTLTGRVTNLRNEAVLGALSGPAFEARVEADEGDLLVRYILTDAGVKKAKKKPAREYLN